MYISNGPGILSNCQGKSWNGWVILQPATAYYTTGVQNILIGMLKGCGLMTDTECPYFVDVLGVTVWNKNRDAEGELYFDSPKKKIKETTDANTHILSSNGLCIDRRVLDSRKQLLDWLKQFNEGELRGIVCCGNLPLVAVVGEQSANAWRGSTLTCDDNINVLVTLDPHRLITQPEVGLLAINDLNKTNDLTRWQDPKQNITIAKTAKTVVNQLQKLRLQAAKDGGMIIANDIETRYKTSISVWGIAWSKHDALVVPFIRGGYGRLYWPTLEEEMEVVQAIRDFHHDPNIHFVGQNYHYDAQYLAACWGILPTCYGDTMVLQHTKYANEVPKSLATLASMYCHHYKYWKEEADGHEPSEEGEWGYYIYNGKDCLYTYECFTAMNQPDFWDNNNDLANAYAMQMGRWPNLLKTMLRGVRYAETERRNELSIIKDKIEKYQQFFNKFLPKSCMPDKGKTAKAEWYDSPTQLSNLLYKKLSLKKQYNKTANRMSLTSDENALDNLKVLYPELSPFLETLLQYRRLSKFRSTYLECQATDAGRIHTFFKLTGTDTFRLASTKDAFGQGLNMQNLPGEK